MTRNHSRGLLNAGLLVSVALLAACGTTKTAQPSTRPDTTRPLLGSIAPDFTLDDAHGGKVTLSKIAKPTLIVYHLGYDCPYCVRHLRDIADSEEDFEKLNVQILTIDPYRTRVTRHAIREFGDFPFPMLSDPDKSTAAAYGLLVRDEVVFHGVYVLDANRKVHFSRRTDHPYENSDELLRQFRAMTPTTRPSDK